MSEQTSEIAGTIPNEIRRGVDAFSGENEQAVVVTLLNENQLSFTDLKEETGLHPQSLTNALEKLRRGGLIRKRSSGDFEQENARYEVSEYGERFVDCLLESLGSVDGFREQEMRFEAVDHIHSSTHSDQHVFVERYASKGGENDQANMTS